ncbi:transcription factor TFIID complex subunit 8 C-term-domain-containing protein [Dipodascopsis tothii]|uniref:transcription factor TFIID complex subunit 8 C-term-domain-containing protein n=1 Tax=Dipodascopsis tothii TaxID=44089 RepID=UPI0034CD4D85
MDGADDGDLLLAPVAAILASLGVPCTAGALETVAVLAHEYLAHLFEQLHRYTAIQRRSRPSIRDLAYVCTAEGIHTGELEAEMERSAHAARPPPPPRPAAAAVPAPPPALAAAPERREYVPAWMPDFPADHTYRATPQYTERVTSPRAIRERLIAEGNCVEAALRALTGADAHDATADDVLDDGPAPPAPPPRSGFDIAAYAARRAHARNPIILHIGKKIAPR